jgi:hypothetical protein
MLVVCYLFPSYILLLEQYIVGGIERTYKLLMLNYFDLYQLGDDDCHHVEI